MYLDNYCPNPGFRFTDYAVALTETAKKATSSGDGAFTVGIFGKWGSGKTTLMRCIEQEFLQYKNRDKTFESEVFTYRTIWFSPWKYDTKEKIWNALIQTILAEIVKVENLDAEARKTCQDLAWLMRFYAYEIGRELMLGLIKQQIKQNVGIDITELKKISHSDSITSMYRGLNRFEQDFKDVVEKFVGVNGHLIVFIDDLDRCLPEDALTVLEALKLYLDRANCIFFIGLDKRTIEKAVQAKYSAIDITGKDYIEKMIQLSFFLPANPDHKIIEFLQGSVNALAHHIDKNIWSLICIATEQNLRRIKQFLVAWNLVRDLLFQADEKTYNRIAFLLLLQNYFPKFYESLPKSSYSFMSRFIELFDKNKTSEELRNILSLSPELKEFYENDNLRAFIETALKEEGTNALIPIKADDVRASMLKLAMIGQNPL